MEKRTPPSKKMHSSGQQINKHSRHTQDSNKRPRLAPDSVKKKTIKPSPQSSTPSSRRMDDIRLIIESSLSDDDLWRKVGKVQDELQAVELALADEGTYLGIVDKVCHTQELYKAACVYGVYNTIPKFYLAGATEQQAVLILAPLAPRATNDTYLRLRSIYVYTRTICVY